MAPCLWVPEAGPKDCPGALLSCAPDQSCAHLQGHNAVFESLKFDQTSIGGRALPVQPLRGPYQRRRRVDKVRGPVPAAIGLTHSTTSGLMCGARRKSRCPGANPPREGQRTAGQRGGGAGAMQQRTQSPPIPPHHMVIATTLTALCFAFACTAAQTGPVPNAALRAPHGAAVECFPRCLGQPSPFHWRL